jgi:chromosomal replication initiator protein
MFFLFLKLIFFSSLLEYFYDSHGMYLPMSAKLGTVLTTQCLTSGSAVWTQCLEYLQALESVSAEDFSSWVCPLQAQLTAAKLIIIAPNQIVFDQFDLKIFPLLEIYIRETFSNIVHEIKLSVRKTHEDIEDKEPVIPQFLQEQEELDLNPSYTFSSFVIGKSNQMSEAAAEQVAQFPGKIYNPLFLYGGVGLGKTHLMHAVGNKIKQASPHLNVKYLHSERFVAQMVKAIQTGSLAQFKKEYSTVDVLMVDDIQFFAGKDRTQEEFFFAFNNLISKEQQIILTSDRYPKDLGGIADRLKSRFGSGLTVAIDPPELETRVAILNKKAVALGIEIDSRVAFFIAQKIRSNVRELEGALKRVVAHANFMSKQISLDVAQRALKDVVAAQEHSMSAQNIMQVVADFYKIPIDKLCSPSRMKKYSWPRQVAMGICKELTSMSYIEIGKAFGGRDHTTVIHACKKVLEIKSKDGSVDQDYREILRAIVH